MKARSVTISKIDISADDRVWTPIGAGALNIGASQCIAELVSNSLDWLRPSPAEQNEWKSVDIKKEEGARAFFQDYSGLLAMKTVDPVIQAVVGKDKVEVLDNGIGMTIKELETGLQLRGADDTKRRPLRKRRGMFGMGLKVGVLGLGWKVTVATRSFREPGKEHTVSIDTRRISAGKLHLDEIEVLTSAPDKKGPLGDWVCGTSIRVEDLHRHNHNPGDIRQELGRAFTPDIRWNGLLLNVVDATGGKPIALDPCTPDTVPIIEKFRVDLDKLNLLVRPDNGDGTRGSPLKIRGWLALRTKASSGKGAWGVHTFRHNQLVEPFHHDGPATNGLLPRDPHPMYARLHGEVHLDMCDPNFTKVGWNTERKSWSDARDALRKHLDELMEESKAYRVSSNGAQAYQMHQQFQNHAKQTVSKISAESGASPENTPSSATAKVESEDLIRLPNGDALKISVTEQPFSEAGQTEKYWRYNYREDSHELAIFVNSASPLWREGLESKDRDRFTKLVANWAILDSLFFCLTASLEMDVNEALSLRQRWLQCVYPEPEEA